MSSLRDFIGATEYEDGARGLVPAPVVGDQLKFLQGSGAWIDIPAYRWSPGEPAAPPLSPYGQDHTAFDR